ncbi:hypothetical protein AVEN_49251-1 [Araneus ventricosus]|uniref:Uncharacterized protein n=1 Tax=Araneus ventricosus TaxID=182803 RepID=A0A4Y2UQK6_ARAVE|nr:hypothetical protein AVEN_49251-1 [Araneus ventricosus]
MTTTTPEFYPLSKLPHHTSGVDIGLAAYDLTCRTPITRWCFRRLVSNLEPYGPNADTLPLGHLQ